MTRNRFVRAAIAGAGRANTDPLACTVMFNKAPRPGSEPEPDVTRIDAFLEARPAQVHSCCASKTNLLKCEEIWRGPQPRITVYNGQARAVCWIAPSPFTKHSMSKAPALPDFRRVVVKVG